MHHSIIGLSSMEGHDPEIEASGGHFQRALLDLKGTIRAPAPLLIGGIGFAAGNERNLLRHLTRVIARRFAVK
jgi:hypothetical protein